MDLSNDYAIALEPIKEENEVFVVFNGNKYYVLWWINERCRERGKPYEWSSDRVREN